MKNADSKDLEGVEEETFQEDQVSDEESKDDSQEDVDDFFDVKDEDDDKGKVELDAINQATGRSFKDSDDVVKWAKNITKYVGANKDSRGAKEAKEFQEKTGKTPTEFLKQGNIEERLEEIEISQKRPEILPVLEEAKALAKAKDVSIEEVYDKSEKLQKLSSVLSEENQVSENINTSTSRLRIGKDHVEDMSQDKLKANFQKIKNKIIKEKGL